MRKMEKREAWQAGVFQVRGKHTQGTKGRKNSLKFTGNFQEHDEGWGTDKDHIPISLYASC